jgi:hypothetical protein
MTVVRWAGLQVRRDSAAAAETSTALIRHCIIEEGGLGPVEADE